jgi:hypothetical protein
LAYVREAEHDRGASLVGDEGAEVAARPVNLAQVLGVDHGSRHRRRLSRGALEIGEPVGKRGQRRRVGGDC